MEDYIISWYDQDGTRWYQSFNSLSDREMYLEEVVREAACGDVGFFTLTERERFDDRGCVKMD